MVFFLLVVTNAYSKGFEVKNTELQWSVCEPSPLSIIQKLGVTVKNTKTQRLSLFDTTDLRLYSRGVILRLRGVLGDLESTVKVKMGFLNAKISNSSDIKCENDVYRDESKTACALKYNDASYSKLVSKEQVEFLENVAPIGGVNLQNLREFGPHLNTVIKINQHYAGYEVTIDHLKLKSGKELTEISFKVPLEKTNLLFNLFSQELQSKGVKLCAEQTGRAKKILTE